MKRRVFGWGVGFLAMATSAALLLVSTLKAPPRAEAVALRDPSKVSEIERELILNKIREGDLRAIQKDLDGARRAWGEARRAGQGLWPIHEGLGDSYARARLFDDALREWATAAPLVPETLPAVRAGLAAKRAYVLGETGRPLEALRAYLDLNLPSQTGPRILDLALKSEPEAALKLVAHHAEIRDPRVFPILAAILEKLGRKGEAAEAIARFSIAQAPWDEALNRQVIAKLREAKKVDRVLELCRAWAKASPGAIEPYRHMGDALRDSGREKEAILAYTSIVDVKPGDPAAHRMLGDIFKEMKRWDEAIEQVLAAKRARPEDQGAYLALVSLYEAKGDPIRAEETLLEGVKRTGLGGDLRTKLVSVYTDRIASLKAAGKAEEVRALRKKLGELNVPEAGLFDLKIIMTWDAPSDVDLDVYEPSGEHIDHGHSHSKAGGHYYVDNTQGFGPETYTLPTAAPGTYRIGAHLHGQTKSRVKFVILLYEDTPREERREETLLLEATDGGAVKLVRDLIIPN
jgi:tetratricopeptide (TPR) repeat protein